MKYKKRSLNSTKLRVVANIYKQHNSVCFRPNTCFKCLI